MDRRLSRPSCGKCVLVCSVWTASFGISIYELGKKRLLKKCEYKFLPESGGIMWLDVNKDRIFAADSRDSILVLRWRYSDNQMQVSRNLGKGTHML